MMRICDKFWTYIRIVSGQMQCSTKLKPCPSLLSQFFFMSLLSKIVSLLFHFKIYQREVYLFIKKENKKEKRKRREVYLENLNKFSNIPFFFFLVSWNFIKQLNRGNRSSKAAVIQSIS